METIYKYQLKTQQQQTIIMPVDSEILTLQVQSGAPCIWVRVDTNNELGDRNFIIVGTGEPLPEIPIDYIGSFQTGEFVFHVFELSF